MPLLGIGGSDHDFSVAVIENGRVAVSIEDERLTRTKHGRGEWHSHPLQPSLDYCLKFTGFSEADFDTIESNLHLEQRALDGLTSRVKAISHHLAHGACAFFPSPFERAAVVVIDGAGNRVWCDERQQKMETVSIGTGLGNHIRLQLHQSGERHIATCFWRYVTADSLGAFYGIVGEALGFGPFGAGKTMGIAAYGNLSLKAPMAEFLKIDPGEGRFQFDPYGGLMEWLAETLSRWEHNPFQTHADIAAAAQSLFEDAVLAVMRHAHRLSGENNLCYGGGCALNSVCNQKILQQTPFQNLFIYPAPGDNGTAVGAALYAHYVRGKAPRETPGEAGLGGLAYLGRPYSEAHIKAALERFPVYGKKSADITGDAAWMLHEGEVIGWFQGRSEIGPRALGNRSILADPTRKTMRDHINRRIKGRETFRPLAPAVTVEAAPRYFECDRPSPFMSRAVPVRPRYRRKLHSVTHVDGTARLQTVDAEANPLFYELLQKFSRFDKPPILLNTSFNLKDEPIVETPEDAINCFLNSKLDHLILGDYIVERHTPFCDF